MLGRAGPAAPAVRVARVLGAILLLALGLSGCVAPSSAGDGPYRIAGGGPAGVYYSYGEQLAEALHRDLGIDIAVVETHGSVENLRMVASGEALIGFAQGDTAADAIDGAGGFGEPLPVRAVARVYDEYVHVVVPADSDVQRISDLAGLRVSLGAPNSGVQVIAARVLEASDVDVSGIVNPELGPDASIDALQKGEIEGFFWVGGLPTPGIERLAKSMPIRLLSIEANVVERVNSGHAGVYRLADFPVGLYGVDTPTATMTVPNYLVAAEDASEDLIYDVSRVLFESRSVIASKIAAAEFLDRRQAIFTSPMELHPGAARYYVDARR
ncbi:MAG: TAXI family TRAP transporter solute-binding subunit [Leucobacter sp.]